MAFFQNAINKVANAFADLLGVVPVGEYNATPPTVTDGDAVNLQVDAAGNLKVASAGTATLPTGASTEAKQDTGNASLASIDGKVATAAKQDTQTTALGNILTAIQLNATESSLASLLSEVRDLATEAALATLGSEIKFRQEAGNSHLNDISGKLPASLGAKTAAASLSVTPATDAVFSVAAPENAFQTVRTWAGATADSEPALDGSAWVALTGANAAGYVVQLYEITAVGGTVAPTQVTFKTWIRVGGAGGTVQKIDEWTAESSWLTTAAAANPYWRRIIPVNCDEIFVTATFPDGTSPTITGTVKCRAIAHAGLQRRDFTYDPATGLPKFQSASYDSAMQTEKVSDSYKECDLYLEEPLVIDTTGLTAGTEYPYPSADGVLTGLHDSFCWEYSAAAGGGGTIEIWWEATNGSSSWSQRNVITLSGSELTTSAKHAATPLSSATTLAGITQFDNINVVRHRMIVKPVTANSGAVKISLRRKVRGS